MTTFFAVMGDSMFLPFARASIATTLLLTVFAFPPAASLAQAAAAVSGSPAMHKPPSELQLYHALFSIVAHMERDRLARVASPESQVGDIAAAEESLRKAIGLSKESWQSFVTTAVKVDVYTEQIDRQASAYARQRREASLHSVNAANTITSVRTGLHKMQLDQDTRMLEDVKGLEAGVGADSTAQIHAYLHGPLADSAHATKLRLRGKGAE